MRKFLISVFKKIVELLAKEDPQVAVFEKKDQEIPSSLNMRLLEKLGEKDTQSLESATVIIDESPSHKDKEKQEKIAPKKKAEIISYPSNPIRDVMDLMGVPFLALSKKRRNPIIYESADGTQKVKITRHTGHFLASIYDWDIVLFVAGKIQEIVNNNSDIPPRTMVFPRHEILKVLHKHNVNTQQKELEQSLSRLQLTGIDTTIHNKDGKYRAGFGFIDNWRYTEREDIKEIKITLSDWLYDMSCAKGALLKVDPDYFDLTSGLKRFLYRTARKHAGKNEDGWEFSIESLYEKSGSEREFKKFKSDLRRAIIDNDIPEYSMKWIEKNGKPLVVFKRSKIHEIDRLVGKFAQENQNLLLDNSSS